MPRQKQGGKRKFIVTLELADHARVSHAQAIIRSHMEDVFGSQVVAVAVVPLTPSTVATKAKPPKK